MLVGALDNAGRKGAEICGLALEACPAGMIVVASNGAIVLVNGEVERLFGYARDELIGQPVEILLPESLRAEHAGDRHAFTADREPRRFASACDFAGRHKDGAEFPVEIGLNPICVGGETMVVAAIVHCGEHKRRERVQDDIVATVSHELRTPLTSIAASLGLLLAGSADNLPQPAAHLLRIAHANCQRLLRMVSDILDSKKLGSGRMAFLFSRCEARALLEQAIEANGGLAAGCGVGIRLEAAPSPIEIEVDPDRFIQVITNLLSNALKFSSPGGEVVVALKRRGEDIRIEVRDRGPGVPAEFKPLVFEAFTQAESHTGHRRGGSGLGLSIAREMVMHMHGRIGFADAPGGGTVFHVDLPEAGRAALGRAASAG